MSDAESLRSLAQRFEHFADRECTEDAIYVALCRLIARRPDALRLLLRAEVQQQRPNLLLAALHARVLAGGAPSLRPYYASVGGVRPPDAALEPALDSALRLEHAALAQLVASHTTQTNEIGRCAVLWPVLMAIARRHACTQLALLDFGCSAGLNLGVDRYHHDYADFALGAPAAPATPRIVCRLIGTARPGRAAQPLIVQRLGVDPVPASVHDVEQVAWLRACLWPGDRLRAARFDQAVAIAQQEAWPVERHADCAAAIEPWLDALPADVLPVVFNSWVLAYFDPAARRRHIAFMHQLVRRRHLVWLSAEHHSLVPAQAAVPAPAQGDPVVADAEVANGSLWWAVDRFGAAALARSHPHGRWMQWLDDGASAANG